jgi:hypothetical protein
MSRERREH